MNGFSGDTPIRLIRKTLPFGPGASRCTRSAHQSSSPRQPELFTVSFIGPGPWRAFCPAVPWPDSRLPPSALRPPGECNISHMPQPAGKAGKPATDDQKLCCVKKFLAQLKNGRHLTYRVSVWLSVSVSVSVYVSVCFCTACVCVRTRSVCWPCLRLLGAHLIRRSCLGVVPAFVQAI